MDQTIGDIEDIIFYNDDKTLDKWGQTKGRHYAEETMQEFKLGIWYLRQALTYTQRIDWLLAGAVAFPVAIVHGFGIWIGIW